MRSRATSALAVLFSLSIATFAGNAAAQGRGAACDRACLINLGKSYVAAVAAHNPSAVPLAADVAFIENVTRVKPGEGLWASATAAPKDFAIYVPDVDQQQVGFLGVMERNGQSANEPVMVAMRVKLAAGKIVEAEHIVAAVMANNLARLQTPRAGLLSEVPAASRKSHRELAKIGLSYYDALDDNDGTLMPFADDCERHENGMVTAGPTAGPGPNADPNRAPVARLCAPQLSSKTFTYIDRIENRRLIAAQPVTGLAMGFSHFRHPLTNLPYKVIHTDGSTTETTKENFRFNPFDLPAAHIFKVGADGKVHEIEAVGFTAPLNSPTGWEGFNCSPRASSRGRCGG